MKTYVIGKPYDTGRLCGELSAAGVVSDIRGDGVIVTDDSAVDATVNAVIAAHSAVPRTPRTLGSLKPLLTPALVTRLYLSAKLWAYAQDDFALHDLANRSADSSTALLLVATWLQSNPSGAQAQGINLRGDQ